MSSEKEKNEKITYNQSISQEIFVNKEEMQDFICPLCNGILYEPIQDSCQHVFCLSCYNKCKENNINCPISNKPFINEKSTQLSLISNVINKMNVYCVNKNKNCNWIGKFLQLKSHLLKDCQKEIIICIYEGCNQNMKREDLQSHIKICDWRTEECLQCHKFIAHLLKQEHDDICPKKIIKCEQCNMAIMRELLENHKKDTCECTFINCIFKDFGCNETMMRKDCKKKMFDDLPKHLNLICQFIQNENKNIFKIINEKDKKINELTKKCDELSQELSKFISQPILLNQKRSREKEKEKENINYYDLKNLPKEIIINNGKAKLKTEKNNNYYFCFANEKFDINLKGIKIEYNWRILLGNSSNWIGFGLCDKLQVILNDGKFIKKDNNFNNGSFVISSNGYMFNCNNRQENLRKIDFPLYDDSHEFNLKYNVIKKELIIYSSINILAILNNVESFNNNNKLTPVIIFMHANDSAMFIFN